MLDESYNMDALLIDDDADVNNSSDYNIVEGDVQLDLTSYMSAYHGYIYYRRLFFISQRCPALRITALRLAHDYIKKHTYDIAAYTKVFTELAELQAATNSASAQGVQGDLNRLPAQVEQRLNVIQFPGAGELVIGGSPISDAAKMVLTDVMAGKNEAGLCHDVEWEKNTRYSSKIQYDKLDTELKNYQANSIKESIRRAYDAIGHLYLKMGFLEEARKCYIRTRDYCTSEQQEISMCLNVIKLAIFQGEWPQVNANVTRAYHLLEVRDANSGSAAKAAAIAAAEAAAAAAASATATAVLSGAIPSTSASSRDATGHQTRQLASYGDSAGGPVKSRDCSAQYRTALAIASGLVDLSAKNFHGAALKFVKVNPEHLESPTSSLVSQSDLGLLVTLCSLASLERSELVRLVLGAPAMRLLLETEPVCRDMLQAFHQADYSSLLTRLYPPSRATGGSGSGRRISTALRDQLRLDIFLADRYTQLVKDIRARAMCQYFSPYSSASLPKMAAAFDTTVADLENELTHLIQQGSIKARIDSHKQLLRVVNVDQRCMTFSRAMQLVDEYQRRTHSMILRLSLVRQKLIRPYFSPYSSASLPKMAAAFDTTVADLENELTHLIQQGSIKARIDSHKQLLRVVNVDQRCMTFSRAMQLVDEYQRRTHSMILRLSLVRQKLIRPAHIIQ